MTVALIKISPQTFIQAYSSPPNPLKLPGSGGGVFDARVGWTDGNYSLVAVVPFTTPHGQQNIGQPSYSFDAGGNVVETYATQTTPLNIIPFAIFIGRWTTTEYALLMQKRAAAVSAGTAGAMALVIQWDQALAIGQVDLNSVAAQNFKAALVSASILTQVRADAIFS